MFEIFLIPYFLGNANVDDGHQTISTTEPVFELVKLEMYWQTPRRGGTQELTYVMFRNATWIRQNASVCDLTYPLFNEISNLYEYLGCTGESDKDWNGTLFLHFMFHNTSTDDEEKCLQPFAQKLERLVKRNLQTAGVITPNILQVKVGDHGIRRNIYSKVYRLDAGSYSHSEVTSKDYQEMYNQRKGFERCMMKHLTSIDDSVWVHSYWSLRIPIGWLTVTILDLQPLTRFHENATREWIKYCRPSWKQYPAYLSTLIQSNLCQVANIVLTFTEQTDELKTTATNLHNHGATPEITSAMSRDTYKNVRSGTRSCHKPPHGMHKLFGLISFFKLIEF